MREIVSRRTLKIVLAAFFCGVVAVLIAGATVEVTDRRAFCGMCHTMAPHAWTHYNSTHAQFNCGECHLPSNLVAKLPYKAQIGLYDLFVEVTGTKPSTMHADAKMKDVIQANCIRCHQSTIADVAMDVKQFCTDCHKSIPHQPKMPIDSREAADV